MQVERGKGNWAGATGVGDEGLTSEVRHETPMLTMVILSPFAFVSSSLTLSSSSSSFQLRNGSVWRSRRRPPKDGERWDLHRRRQRAKQRTDRLLGRVHLDPLSSLSSSMALFFSFPFLPSSLLLCYPPPTPTLWLLFNTTRTKGARGPETQQQPSTTTGFLLLFSPFNSFPWIFDRPVSSSLLFSLSSRLRATSRRSTNSPGSLNQLFLSLSLLLLPENPCN